MSGLSVEVAHVPTIDHLDHNTEKVIQELARVTEHARELFARMQDVDAELAGADLAADSAGGALALKHELAYELRRVARHLHRAQLHLVMENDDRHAAAQDALRWLDDAERDDRPWKVAA